MNNCITCDLLIPALEEELDRLKEQRRIALFLADRLIAAKNYGGINGAAFFQEATEELQKLKKICK